MDENHMQHGRHWGGQNVRGWWASEKFRGCRVFWDGATMWTRGGLPVALPAEWLSGLPQGRSLDGELWAGRGPANGPEEVEAVAAAVRGVFTPRIRFLVFDAPDVLASWPERMASAAALLQGCAFAQPVGFAVVKNLRALEDLFLSVVSNGGEGLMVRSPKAPAYYEPVRTAALLKVKRDPALARGVVRLAA